MILEVLEHRVSRQLRVDDLRRGLDLNRLLQREITRGAANEDAEFSRTTFNREGQCRNRRRAYLV
jgi:hypothetical protein